MGRHRSAPSLIHRVAELPPKPHLGAPAVVGLLLGVSKTNTLTHGTYLYTCIVKLLNLLIYPSIIHPSIHPSAILPWLSPAVEGPKASQGSAQKNAEFPESAADWPWTSLGGFASYADIPGLKEWLETSGVNSLYVYHDSTTCLASRLIRMTCQICRCCWCI